MFLCGRISWTICPLRNLYIWERSLPWIGILFLLSHLIYFWFFGGLEKNFSLKIIFVSCVLARRACVPYLVKAIMMIHLILLFVLHNQLSCITHSFAWLGLSYVESSNLVSSYGPTICLVQVLWFALVLCTLAVVVCSRWFWGSQDFIFVYSSIVHEHWGASPFYLELSLWIFSIAFLLCGDV